MSEPNKFYSIEMPYVRAQFGLSRIEVLPSSLKSQRNVVEKLAYYFRREFGYGFPQYSADDPAGAVAYLFLDPMRAGKPAGRHTLTVPIGAACFRKRRYTNLDKEVWVLDWVWLHPYQRNKQVLSENWEFFVKKFGNDFHVERPLSKSMEAFLTKKGHLSCLERK